MKSALTIYVCVVLIMNMTTVQATPRIENKRDLESTSAGALASIRKEKSSDSLSTNSERFLSGFCQTTGCSPKSKLKNVGIVLESGCKVNWGAKSGKCDGFVLRSSCGSRWIKVRGGCIGVYSCKSNKYFIFGPLYCYYKAGWRPKKEHCYKC